MRAAYLDEGRTVWRVDLTEETRKLRGRWLDDQAAQGLQVRQEQPGVYLVWRRS